MRRGRCVLARSVVQRLAADVHGYAVETEVGVEKQHAREWSPVGLIEVRAEIVGQTAPRHASVVAPRIAAGRTGRRQGATVAGRALRVFPCEQLTERSHVGRAHARRAHFAGDVAYHLVQLLGCDEQVSRHEDGGRQVVERLGGYGTQYRQQRAFRNIFHQVEYVLLQRVILYVLQGGALVVDMPAYLLCGVEVHETFVAAQTLCYVKLQFVHPGYKDTLKERYAQKNKSLLIFATCIGPKPLRHCKFT